MKRHVTEYPDRWVIIKITDNDYRVFASWAGGYLNGDRWKLNSGIVKVEQDNNFYYFIGSSGSCYQCRKKLYGVASSYCERVLDQLIDNSTKHSGGDKIEIMEDNDNWQEIIITK